MFTIITLPSGFTSDITANASSLFTDLSPYTTLILGVLLGIVVITILIKTIRGT